MPLKFSPVRRAGAAIAGLTALVGLAGCAADATVAGVPLWPDFVRDGGGPVGSTSVSGGAAGGTLGVNGYLWSAALQTLSFLPLSAADPYGGVINYDWYVNPEKTDERFKATVYILDTRLRADGLNVAITKETQGPGGTWVAAAANPQTETDLENAILTKARQLRLGNSGG